MKRWRLVHSDWRYRSSSKDISICRMLESNTIYEMGFKSRSPWRCCLIPRFDPCDRKQRWRQSVWLTEVERRGFRSQLVQSNVGTNKIHPLKSLEFPAAKSLFAWILSKRREKLNPRDRYNWIFCAWLPIVGQDFKTSTYHSWRQIRWIVLPVQGGL